MNRYFRENEEIVDLTPEEAKKVLALNGGKTIGDEAEDVLEDIASLPTEFQYDEREDPEMMEESCDDAFRHGLRSARMTENVMNFREAASWIQDELFSYWDENGFDDSEEAFDDFKNNYYETPEGKKPMNDAVLQNRWQVNAFKYKSTHGDNVAHKEPDFDESDPTKGLSAESAELLQQLIDFDDEGLSAAESAEDKYNQLSNIAAAIFMGQSFKKHAFICGDAGVGKTYAIEKIAEKLWPKSPLNKQGWTYTYAKGDIGNSLMPILAFFFEHREKEVIVLDDADAFLETNDAAVMNLMKGMLNTENTITNPQPVFVRATMRLGAPGYMKNPQQSLTKTETEQKYVNGDFITRESNIMSINAQKFNEGILEVSLNGNVICNRHLTESEQDNYSLITPESKARKREAKNLLGMGYTKRLSEVEPFYSGEDPEAEEFNTGEMELGWDPEFGGGKNEDGKLSLPAQFIFTSRLIMISNLAPNKVNEAFKSRCDVVAITLTQEEFVAHLAQVVPGLMKDMETTLPTKLVDMIKNENYGYLKRLIEMKGRPIGNGQRIEINIPLQFRLIPEMSGKWLAAATAYCRKFPEVGPLSVKNFRQVATAIGARFVKNTLVPFLADTQYSGDPNRRRK